jgi:hypothetical protein
MSTLLPPGAITANVLVDATPRGSSRAARLMLCGLLNSFTFDWAARQFVAATVNQFILGNLLLPSVARDVEAFVVHGALRLSCNHACYAPLWSEQLGDAWHEQRMRNDWPALHSEDERWGVRAAIDAVVADAYALSRSFYAHVLAGFSHKMYPKAAERCLAAFDELRQIGVSAFAERHDPYYGIPLNKALATPVIALPVASEPSADATHISLMSEARPKRSRKGKA